MGCGSSHSQGDRANVTEGEGIETRLVTAGRRGDWTHGLVNPPVYRASTILFDSVADLEARAGKEHQLSYGRLGTPTTWALEEALTALEPASAGTLLFPSGLTAISTALLAVLRPGDALLVPDSVYGPTRAFCDGMLRRWGVETIYYDPMIGTDIEDLFSDRTRAIFMESPGSLTFEVQDVPGICALSRRRGIVTLLDNTWATPLYFPAMAAGVDLSIVSCTKYIGGHSDVMMGSVTAAPGVWGMLQKTSRLLGQAVGPDDAALVLRGLRTLEVRLRRHFENGLRVAGWLAEQPQVARVIHPAFPGSPGHELWKRDFGGAAGLFSIVLTTRHLVDRTRFIDALRHFGIGFSWGGYESLVLPVDLDRIRTVTSSTNQEGLIVRLHVGLENPDDLILDLAQGLAKIGEAA